MDEIRHKIDAFLEKKDISVNYEVSIPEDVAHGDVTTNAALVIASEIGQNPREIAEGIADIFSGSPLYEKVEIAGPGFINFYLSKAQLTSVLKNPVTQIESHFNDRKIAVEFGDPNPFKQIHIGHLRNFAIGESFSRILEHLGAKVIRVNYQGDVGLHVAKALYGLTQNPEFDISSSELSDEQKGEKLGKAYAYGATEYEENESAREAIRELNKKVYQSDSSVEAVWEEGRRVSLGGFDRFYERIGVSYDKKYFESETSIKGREMVLDHIEDGIFERSDDAVVYRGEQEGLHTRVFVTRENYATYEGKDLGLAFMKEADLHPDYSYILTGNEQAEYFKVMLSALSKIDQAIADKTEHFTFGHVRLKEGKMSSRTGDVITAEWLLDEGIERVLRSFSDMDSETGKKVGTGAVKYSMLKFGIASDIHFDFDESISLEGNSGPYLQYTYVRTQSVLERAGQRGQELDRLEDLNEEEEHLIRFLTRYPFIVREAAEKFAPNLVCNYLFELSQMYNNFYQKHKIIDSPEEKLRLHITRATGEVLKSGFHLLGIETVEKM